MKRLLKLSLLALLAEIATVPAFSQCQNWNNSPQKDALEEAHVLYRQFMKTEEYDNAFEYWKKAFDGAPAADGQRSTHFKDGQKIYLHKFKKETDAAKKKEYADMVVKLYDQQVQCYPKEAGDAYGKKVYDMFYVLNSAYPDTKKAAQMAVESGGNSTSYVVFQPYATIAVFQFQNQQMQAEEARNIYTKLNEIADHNVANNQSLSAYYKQAKDAMNATFAQIENQIFDCAYFKTKLEPQYRADPKNTEVIKTVYLRLSQQGCPAEDPLVAELKVQYETLVIAENAAKLAEYYAANPGDHAIALFKEGDYTHALRKFSEAIDKEEAGGKDKEKLANYYFYLASIEFRQLDRYSNAREHARKAAQLKPGWGQPYMLIGDMYASTSNSCGSDAFEKQLAVIAAIDKWAYARSIDSEVSSEASQRIARYNDHLPDKEEAFMRKVTEGQSMSVGCWIGETVRVRFK